MRSEWINQLRTWDGWTSGWGELTVIQHILFLNNVSDNKTPISSYFLSYLRNSYYSTSFWAGFPHLSKLWEAWILRCSVAVWPFAHSRSQYPAAFISSQSIHHRPNHALRGLSKVQRGKESMENSFSFSPLSMLQAIVSFHFTPKNISIRFVTQMNQEFYWEPLQYCSPASHPSSLTP